MSETGNQFSTYCLSSAPRKGPYSLSELRGLIESREISPFALVHEQERAGEYAQRRMAKDVIGAFDMPVSQPNATTCDCGHSFHEESTTPMPSIAPQAVPPRDAAQQLGAMKLGRILTAITIAILVGSMFAYETVKQNDIAYQSHPMVCVITDFFSSSLVGLIFYFGSGWIARRKARQANKATAAFPEDRYYDQVARELRNKTLIPGLWTKAYAEANGDEAKARALYIKYRVAQLASLG